MIVPWSPVIFIDIFGSALTLLLACWCAVVARQLIKQKPDDVFRNYIFLFTLAIGLFAISRSFGHLVKQVLLLHDMNDIWLQISPFSGAINSATFVIIFAFGIYFHRFQGVHAEIEYYKNNLEELIIARTAELEKSKHTLENILNNSNPLNITSVNYEIIRANDAYYAIWPKTAGEGKAERCYNSRPGSSCNTDQCPIRQILNGAEVVSHEVSKTFDGETREFIATARPFRDVDGTLIGMVESFQDITKRKQAEMAIIETDRMKSEFISLAAHELNTPLSSMMGYTEFLCNPELMGNFSEEQKQDFLHEISDRGEALRRIIDDLLDISRIESGNPLPLALKETDLIEFLNRKAKLFLTGDSGDIIRLELPERPRCSLVKIDQQRINQALDNILGNAIKYSAKGQEIVLRATESDDTWEIRIEDKGIGMRREQLDHIFDKFYRGDSSNTAISGLGLGMSISKQAIEAHGGTIRVESIEGQGTTVIITLPVSPPEGQRSEDRH